MASGSYKATCYTAPYTLNPKPEPFQRLYEGRIAFMGAFVWISKSCKGLVRVLNGFSKSQTSLAAEGRFPILGESWELVSKVITGVIST